MKLKPGLRCEFFFEKLVGEAEFRQNLNEHRTSKLNARFDVESLLEYSS